MRIDSNFKLREIAGETIVVNQGVTDVNMTRIISLNSSAKVLYETMSGKDFLLEDAAMVLVEIDGIDKKQALADAGKWVETLVKCGVIEEQ